MRARNFKLQIKSKHLLYWVRKWATLSSGPFCNFWGSPSSNVQSVSVNDKNKMLGCLKQKVVQLLCRSGELWVSDCCRTGNMSHLGRLPVAQLGYLCHSQRISKRNTLKLRSIVPLTLLLPLSYHSGMSAHPSAPCSVKHLQAASFRILGGPLSLTSAGFRSQGVSFVFES